MTRLALMLLLGVSLPTEAGACHRFSVWKYPRPQRCAVLAQVVDTKPVQAKPKTEVDIPLFTVSKYDTIILTPKPGRTDEEGRADAIELLRQIMGH